MPSPERRCVKRHPIDIDAAIITASASIPARTLDISAGGIRLIANELVAPETDIALSLSTEEETLLSGCVLWALEIQREKMPPVFEMGITADAFILRELEAIGHADKEAIVQEILSRVRKTAPIT